MGVDSLGFVRKIIGVFLARCMAPGSNGLEVLLQFVTLMLRRCLVGAVQADSLSKGSPYMPHVP